MGQEGLLPPLKIRLIKPSDIPTISAICFCVPRFMAYTYLNEKCLSRIIYHNVNIFLLIMIYNTLIKGMGNDSGEIDYFRAAFDYVLDQRGRGAQNEIAIEIGTSEGFVSLLRSGGRKASNPVQIAIAKFFGYDHLDFLLLGKEILSGRDPRTGQSSVEINKTQPVYVVDEIIRTYGTNRKNKEIISLVVKIMQSGDTDIINALVKNVREFKRAVDMSKRLFVCEDELINLKKEIAEMRDELGRLSAHPDGADLPDAGSEKGAM